MARKKKGRPVNGILVLDKPTGITSNKALQKVKRLFYAQKAGHTGSLDPLATGVLPICLGEATKVSHYLLDADKSYRAKCVLGAVTTTGDADGEVIDQKSVPLLSKVQILEILASFEGPQEQTPPMFSALKHNGRPLYEYARKGIEIERKSRRITLFKVSLLDYSINSENNDDNSEESYIEIEVKCSKGTYIRTLCEDIGIKIGCGAYISELRRIESGPFLLTQSITLDELLENYALDADKAKSLDDSDYNAMDQLLMPTDTAIQSFPAIEINEHQLDKIQHGMTIDVQPEIISDNYRLYHNNILICLAILDVNQQMKPKRILFL